MNKLRQLAIYYSPLIPILGIMMWIARLLDHIIAIEVNGQEIDKGFPTLCDDTGQPQWIAFFCLSMIIQGEALSWIF